MERDDSKSNHLSFLSLPRELRDEIYQHLSLVEGVYLNPEDEGKIARSPSLSGVSKQLEDEYYEVQSSLAPAIAANVRDFDFRHIKAFLSTLSYDPGQKLSPNVQARRLNVVLTLTPECRKALSCLRDWLNLFEAPDDALPALSHFSTTYSLHASAFTGVQSITVMRVMDVVYVDWFLHTGPGRMKGEMGKLCDCLQGLEEKVCGVVRW